MKRILATGKSKGPIDGAVRPTLEQAKAAAITLESLKVKYEKAENDMANIRVEVDKNLRILNQFAPRFAGVGRRSQVQHPRPVGDKLFISAGRAIAAAIREGSDLEQTKTAALKAAAVVGKKYGLPSIPQEVVAKIEVRAQKHFPGVSA
jgi:hypothetical protein